MLVEIRLHQVNDFKFHNRGSNFYLDEMRGQRARVDRKWCSLLHEPHPLPSSMLPLEHLSKFQAHEETWFHHQKNMHVINNTAWIYEKWQEKTFKKTHGSLDWWVHHTLRSHDPIAHNLIEVFLNIKLFCNHNILLDDGGKKKSRSLFT